MEERESTERKSLLIRTILIIILLLLSLLSTILYVYLYPKTTVNLYIDSGADWSEGAPKPYSSFSVKRYSKLSSLPGVEKTGYTFDYWSQDGFEGEEFDLNTELNKEVINLYANYHPNQYVITYWVRDFTAGSNAPWKIYQQQTKEYYTQIDLVTGRDSQNNLLPEFVGRSGFTFYGWTLENRNEDDPELEKYLYIPNSGIEYIYKTPGDMNLYAYFKKNTYDVNLHTGIKYELDETGKPRKDANNKYIIKNASSDTRDAVFTDNVRYMDSLGLVAERHKNMTLGVEVYVCSLGLDFDNLSQKQLDLYRNEANEYAFKGWYLDQDYTIAIDDHELILYVDAVTGVPFYECYIDGVRKVVRAVQKTGADGNPEYDNDGNPKYIFDIYSKWERKCYEVNFNKNTIKANAYQVESIHLYKVNFDEDGNAMGFGKYYNDGLFTYQGYTDGGHYCKVNLANLDVVSDDFRNGITDSGGKPTYRLIGWTDSANLRNNENVAWYAKWTQVPWNRDTVAGSEINGKLATGEISYENQVYTQTSSDDVTLYAQWSQIYNIKFAYDRGSNQKNFVWQGIAGEWFILPNMNDIKANNNGNEWRKTYCFFAGWTTGTSTLSPKYYERIGGKQDAALDPEYYYKISGSQTLLAIWLSEPYTIKFNANGGTLASASDAIKSPVYGNSLLTFPKNKPIRDGYIFNGWSKNQYSDGEYNRLLREATDNGTKLESDKTVYSAGGQYRVTGNCEYFASWMKDYIIEYDANGGEITSGNQVNKYSTLLSADNRSVSGQSNKALLKVRMQIGDKIGIEREGHEFIGWNLRRADGSIDTTVTIKSTKINTPYTTFDFYENKLYAYKSQGGNVDEKSKISFQLIDQLIDESTVIPSSKVVLVASWKPIEYRLKIEDTRASDPTKKTYTYTVEYGQEFTFPELPELIHKVGFQLYGFSTSLEEGKGVTYVIDYNNDGTINLMPTIGGEDSRITQNLTFYTVYVEKKFEIKYFIGETTDKEYTPKTADISQGLISYGQTLVLPKLLESDITNAGFDAKFKFKYWYYTMTDAEGNTVEKIVETGDLATYHNSDNVLILHAKLQVDSYNLILRITNPFEGGDSVIVTDLAIGSYEKGVAVGADAYNQIMYKLNAKLSDILGNYVLKKVMAKNSEGNDTEDIAQLILKGYTFEKFSATETFNQFDFNASTVVQISDSTLYIKTKWVANPINIIYNSDEESTQTNNSSIKYNESLNFLPGTIFTYDGGRVVNSWYIKSTKEGFDPTFFDCSSALKDSKTKYKTLNALSQDGYITWADDGTGTIKLFANTQQICTVTYHYFNGTTEQTIQKQFVFGDSAELLTNDQVPCGEYTFEGWSYKGQKVDYVPVSEGNYNIDLYADYVATITYYNIIKEEIYTKIDKVKQVTITLLKYNEETATYSYTNIYQIENLDLTLTNYDLYGFVDTNTNQLYLIDDIKNGNAYVALDGNNINLEAYYTQDYKLVYSLNDATLETFEDGTTEDKTDVFKFDHNNKPVTAVTIAHKAVKAGYNFIGWKVSGQDTVYGFGATIDLTSSQTTVNPVFGEPTDGTINVAITLVKNEKGDDPRTLAGLATDGSFDVRNGKTFTFAETLIKDKFNWQSDTDDLYRFKVDESTKKYVGGKDYFEIGESFTIPLAIEADTELKFVGEWIKKYVIEFNQDENHQNARYDTKKVILRQGQEYTLQETPTVGTEGVEFQYWQVAVKSGATTQTVNIYVGNIIVVTDQTSYSTRPVIDEHGNTITKHCLPKIDGLNNTYEFVGAWSKKEYTIKLNVIDGSNTYTLTLNNVPYGTKISNRQMLNLDYEYLKLDGTLTTENETALNNILALENNARGIYAWATDAGGTNIADLSSITSDMTLYAVWQTKLTLGFADANDEFEYKDNVKPDTKYLLPNTQIDLNYIVESIYRKGNFTVIYKDGKYQVVGSANDYYQLVAFKLDFADGTSLNLQIDANNSFGKFEITQNTVVTPQFEKVGKVYFFDNTTSTGGNECKIGDTVRFLQFVRNGQKLSLDTFIISRDGFTFVGWNTNKDAETKLDSVTGNGSDINIYAVWASDRKAKFVLRLGNQNYDLFEFALTRLNKINSYNLSHYLTTPAENHQFKEISALSKFPAYSFNNYNLYLINYYVTDSTGKVNYYDNDSLCEQDFGSGSYNSIGDITVYLNTTDIFTIKYSLAGIEGINGNINSEEYFVSADKLDGVNTPFGKLDEISGTIVSLTLPDQLKNNTVQRNNYQPYGWSESSNVTDKNNTKYFFSNQESLVLYDATSASADKEQKLRDIATNLRKSDIQTYNLYLVWEYKYIDTYIYAIADVGTDGTSETVLTAPYDKYKLSTDGTGIAFANVANFLHTYNQSGQRTRIYPLDNNWQFTSNGKIAQVQYNSTIYLNDTTGNIQAGGYQLLGFSKTLYKLGVEVSDNYFKLGDAILVTEDILTDGKLILYPVYGLLADTVAVSTTFGSVNAKIESVTPQGFVGKSTTEAVDEKIEAYRSKAYTLTMFDKITVTASEPMLGYVFKEFHTDDVTQGDITTNVIVVDASCYFVSSHVHNHEIKAHYDTVKVTLNIHLDYKVALKDEYKDNETGVITFKTTLDNADFELSVDKNNLLSSGTVQSTNTFAYTITQSPYYTFALYSDEAHTKIIKLNGDKIVVADLIAGGEANIYVLATPKTHKVIFSLSSNSHFEASSKVTAVSSTYFDFGGGNIEFDIAGGASYVYMGSSLLLPTSATLESSSMKIKSVNSSFVGFYLSGDAGKNIIVNTGSIEKDTTFVELYNSDSITVTYMTGSIIRTFTYTANTVISVGSDVDWDALLTQEYSGAYTLLRWTDGTRTYEKGEQLTIDKAYTFIGVVQGTTIQLVYKYELNGANTTTVVDVEYGKDIEPLTESKLGVSYATKYIAMWRYNDKQFDVSRTIGFNKLGFVYDSSVNPNKIEFDAVYYNKFTYEISYDTTYVNNSGDFASATTVAKSYNNEDTSFVENELKFRLSAVEPISVSDENVFSYYQVEFSVNGGTDYITTQDQLQLGTTLKLISPNNGEYPINVNTPVKYKITPIFKAKSGTITAKFVITNPESNSTIGDDTVLANDSSQKLGDINTFVFFDGNILTDSYLPQITQISDNKSYADWTMQAKSLTFALSLEGFDWNTYKLVGYKADLYDANNNLSETRTFTLGSEAERNLSGAKTVTLTTIWEKRIVVRYYTQESVEDIKLREYYDYSNELTTFAVRGKITDQELLSNTTLADFELNGHEWIGWTSLNDNNHVVRILSSGLYAMCSFGADSQDSQVLGVEYLDENHEICLYPAQAKIYQIKFETRLLDGTDAELNHFEIKADYINNSKYTVYLGKKAIALPAYSAIYSNLSNIFDFKGYTDTTAVLNYFDKDYTFGVENIDNADDENGTITIFANFARKEYTISFSFSGKNGSGEEILKEAYSLSVNKKHGASVSLSYTYTPNNTTTPYIFADNTNLTNGDISLQSVVNRMIVGDECDFLKIKNFTLNGVEIKGLSNITDSVTIVVNFEPIYRLQYNLNVGYENSYYYKNGPKEDDKILPDSSKTNLSGYGVIGETVVDIGKDAYIAFDVNKQNEDDNTYIVMPGFTLKFWKEYNNTQDKDFFDGQNKITITQDLIKSLKITNNYRIQLTVAYSTEYTIFLHYFESIKDMEDRNYSSNVLSITAEKDAVFEPRLKGTLIDAFNNQLTTGIDVNGKTITSLFDIKDESGVITNHGLFNAFDDNDYTSLGLARLGSVDGDLYALMLDAYGIASDIKDFYMVQSYDGLESPLEHHLYIVYVPAKHTVTFNALVGKEKTIDGTTNFVYDSELAAKYVLAEYAMTLDQVNNDDGSENIDSNNRRQVAYTPGWSYSRQTVDFQNYIYLIKPENFKRISNPNYDFVGWKVLITSGSGEDITYSFVELSEVKGLIVTKNKDQEYIKISGIHADLNIVACFVQKQITTEVTLRSTDNLGHKLGIDILDYSKGTALETQSVVENAETCEKIYTFKAVLNSTIQFKSTFDQYKVVSFDFGYTYEGDTITITDAYVVDGKFKIVVTLDYASTKTVYLDVSQGKIGTVNYTYTVDGNDYERSTEASAIQGMSFNGGQNYATYQVVLPLGAKINSQSFGTPTLSNYTFNCWQYFDGKLNDFETLPVSDTTYLCAKYDAKQITVKFAVKNLQNDITKITGIEANITYGTDFTLPTIIVELNGEVTIGYIIDNQLYSFGETFNFDRLTGEIGDEYQIYLTTQKIYSIAFTMGDTTFDWPNNSPYPTVDSEVKVKVVSSPITIESGVEYYFANSVDQNGEIAVTPKTNGYSLTNEYDIPVAEIKSTNGVQFEEWATRTSKTYENGQRYKVSYADADDNGIILFTAVAGNKIKVEFVVIDPQNGQTLKLTTDQKVKPTLESITMLLPADNASSANIIDFGTYNNNYILFNERPVNRTTINAYLAEFGLGEGYKFYGFSSDPAHYTYTNISDFVSKDYAISYYKVNEGGLLVELSDNEKAEALVNAIKAGVRTFYTVWEQKFEVKFVNDTNNQVVSSAYYGKDETIAIPARETVLNANDSNLKIQGWKDTTNTYQYTYQTIAQSLIFEGSRTLEFIPVWAQGHSLTLNMGFDNDRYGKTDNDIRNTVANIFKIYSALDRNEIYAGIGYPYIDSATNVNGVSLIGDGNIVTIGGKNLHSAYRFGELWTENDIIDLSSLKATDSGIYDTLKISFDYGVNISNSYYKFSGWSTEPDGDASKVIKDFSNFSLKTNTILYAVWEPVTYTVTLYATNENADNEVDAKQILEYSFEDSICTDGANIYKNGKGKGFEENVVTDNFKKIGYKLSGWKNFNDKLVLTNLVPVVGNIKLVSEYTTEYIVRFKNIKDIEFSSVERQYVIEGEDITFNKAFLVNKLQVTNAYYLDKTKT
ncbi:MAG: InlB B-repeat-containing protein, partial [Firmicutes bacterium]|nr:InlB B-repeat-containing protein [Bacillota bacterium]